MNTAKPYNKLVIVFKYIRYYLKGLSKHKVHSPTVYSFCTEVLGKTYSSRNKNIEKERKRLYKSQQIIDFKDYGKNGNIFKKNVSDIAKNSLKSKKYARLLAQSAKFYEANQILELGTSLGITTSYLAKTKDSIVTTLEGDAMVNQIANGIWSQLGLKNIKSIVGNFDNTLDTLPDIKYDIIYIDGNHKTEPTVRYFNELLLKAHKKTIFIFDDIHYSKGMELAWNEIKLNNRVTISIDLFFLGYIFINPTLPKQEFTLRY